MLAKLPLSALVLALGFLATPGFAADPQNADWPAYLGDKARTLSSPLQQIDRKNVGQLKVAWT
jgi:quinoprotein glucose dehydrogenase